MRTRLWIGALLLVGVVAAAVLVGRRQPPTRPTDAARTSDTEASAADVVTRVMQRDIYGAQNEDLPPPIYPDYGPLRPGWTDDQMRRLYDYHRGLQDAGITYEQVPAGESAVLVEGMGPLDAARWLVEQARGKHAPEYAKLALEADPSSYEMLMIVGDYLSEQADGEAADYYRRAHELYPDRIDPLIGMARRTQKADLDQALQYLDQAGEIQPNDGWVEYWKGTLRHANGNAVDALPHLEKANDLLGGKAWLMLGAARRAVALRTASVEPDTDPSGTSVPLDPVNTPPENPGVPQTEPGGPVDPERAGSGVLGAAAVDAGAAGAAEALAESAVSEYQQLQTEFLDVFGVDFDFGQSSVVPSEAGGAEPGATPRPGREEYEVMAQRYMDEGDEGRAEEIRCLARERFGEKESEQPPGRSDRKEPRRTPPPAPSSSDD